VLAEFNTRANELNDEDYKKVEVNGCDVKDIQNTPLGVPGFWLRAMVNHGGIARLIQEKDRPILMHLQDVQCNLHTEGYGFELVFFFEKNDYFKNESLRKNFVMTRQNIIEKCDGTEIEWKDASKDVTKKKIKKKQKAKKGQPGKTITKTVEQESFFNFFKTITMPDEKELAEGKPEKPEKDDDEEGEGAGEKDAGELMDDDYDLGNEFKDQLIPLALEYYLEVIEEEEDDEDDECCDHDDGDDHHHGHGHGHGHGKKKKDAESDDDEEEQQPKGGKGGKKKGGAPAGGQQQECKQQ
jgi:nucleosome assembly protein 1-like 1